MESVKTLTVDLGERSYPIWIGQGLLSKLPAYLQTLGITSSQTLLVVTDDHVGALYLEPVLKGLQRAGFRVFSYSVPAGEQAKSLSYYEQIITYALEHKLDRQSVILALGGGVVGDLAGFVASTYMRGIPFVQLPTTLLAHDSSVGGKVAINHPLGKNMIGSFHQPLAVIYDTATLSTLPEREVACGFAEVLKHGFIWDEAFVDWLEENANPCRALQEPFLSEALYRACHIKSQVVSQDEKETGLRAILNFGHTFGHAFEALGHYRDFTHGEAVAIGMAVAAHVSEAVYGQQGLAERVTRLLSTYGLPVEWHTLPWSFEQVLEKMYTDKKVMAGRLRLVLLERMGRAVIADHVAETTLRAVWSLPFQNQL
ncbi:3-dehydroquinate synthase [Caldalkalibacillus thermarum TA2.A1]|uniref:3-dehydroquinate synthase n=1 Tax=Caldalkalibacillus thermarum (strain TA2.A1) TaxID=986075 RepID=F5L727_CALTT|nr:3-dehydroquinate synthase [Caldalkalibacillus thermarum]EGL82862.1 3-dehydroquinate synthase [Caldalkalibacillus thermarum TA2.A1]QZT32716.1 3-dehydroquinate synthase [Caldalkalibacillus thermarum TA2.A1]